MKNIKLVFAFGLLFVGMTVTAAAQSSYKKDGRNVNRYPNEKQFKQYKVQKSKHRQPNRKVYVTLPNGKTVYRSERSRQVYDARPKHKKKWRSYRNTNYRFNGQRIYQ